MRASREKLYRALMAAGLKTQAALADRIADLEQLDAAPRDVVNRVFRELPVEPQTLVRIARALDVEPYLLYKSADEPEPVGEDHAPEALRSRAWHMRIPLVAGTVVAFTVVIVSLAWWFVAARDGVTASASLERGPPLSRLPTLVLLPIDGDRDDVLATALRQSLADGFVVASDTATVVTHLLDGADAARRLRTDYAVTGEVIEVGHFASVHVHLFRQHFRVRDLVWADTLPVVTLDLLRSDIVGRIAAAIRAEAGLAPADLGVAALASAAAHEDYLWGRYHLDRPATELNVRRAQARFNAALRDSPMFARAYAGLCESLLEEYWLIDAQRALDDASHACERALELDADDPFVQIALGFLFRLTGRIDESLAAYRRSLALLPGNPYAFSGKSNTQLLAFRQYGDAALLEAAIASAQAAVDAAPDFWRPLFSLASLYYFAGDLDAAIAANEAALELDSNEYVLANLGSFYFCVGRLEHARDAYQSARDAAPQSYVGDEFLGMLHYLLGDFETSAQLRRRAIDAIGSTTAPEIHAMWGNLADSYRHIGNADAAIDAYLQAAEIVERDFLLGTGTTTDRVSRAYYYTMLEQLAPERVPPAGAQYLLTDLDDIAVDDVEPTAALRLAQLWLHRGEELRARAAYERAVATCRGFEAVPDLVALR